MSAEAPSRAATEPAPPAGVPRLLGPAPADLATHLARYGPLPTVRSRSERAALIEAVERSTLRGRGGGGFPAGRKLRSVAEHARHTIVVANGAEGEPASHKDAVLLTHSPHLVLDGAVVAAGAVRADEVVVIVDRENAAVCAAVDAAIAERSRAGGGLSTVPVRRVGVPNRYVAGEESAVVNFLNGGPAKPIAVPPRPYERGVRGRPTLVQNVETLAHIALIARYGVDWFQTVGPLDESGSMLVTVSGAVARPGVYELALGMPMPDVLAAVGGTSEDMSALLAGGYFGSWIPASALTDLALTRRSFAAAGGSLGCGMLHVFPARACGVRESARVARYLAEETAGQCGPCVHGLSAIAGTIETIARRKAPHGALRDVDRWLQDVAHRGACHLPDAAVGFLTSARSVFADEFDLHERHGRCTHRDAAPVLPLPDPADRDWSWR
jgi:NADH:ubiquinone oxidoreductase subunit F (NADH-binding)